MRRLIQKFIFSKQHLAGMATAIVVALILTGKPYWLVLSAAGYLFGFFLSATFTGKIPVVDETPEEAECLVKASTALDALNLKIAEADWGRSSSAFKLPEQDILANIMANIETLLVDLSKQPLENEAKILVVTRLVSVYLTEMVDNYLNIPLATRKTLTAKFIENLTILTDEISELEASFASQNVDKFMEHSLFLEERFKTEGLSRVKPRRESVAAAGVSE